MRDNAKHTLIYDLSSIAELSEMTEAEFSKRFQELTGNAPLAWQFRLFEKHFATNSFRPVIDLPTGLGKTMVMAIWLIAREVNDKLPRRLIYVVDRRTVVDQATKEAEKLQRGDKELGLVGVGEDKLSISTLRGQFADNRTWSRDPSKPAIVIGTVDLIGSALLFSGYRSGYKTKPLNAGLLGQDSLLVLDEAHLSKPFEKLITSISTFQSGQGSPMKVICMSATSDSSLPERTFTLQFDGHGKLSGEDATDTIVGKRWNAKKSLTIAPPVESKKLNATLADAAIELANDESAVGKRIVVFVRKPDDARTIAKLIRESEIKTEVTTGKKPKTIKSYPYAGSVEVLTGTMRGLERDELVEKEVFKNRWFNGKLDPSSEANKPPVFLIATSAGEVGFDLNADHMVCDATTIDSLIQRLGRVNRRGDGNAIIQLFVAAPKDGKPIELKGYELAIDNTIKLLQEVSENHEINVSPRNIAALKSGRWRGKYAAACSPEPTMVELTDILLDAWSMTSVTTPMPGRPDVAPWLRGIDDELPQTTLCWRAELDLLKNDPRPEKALEAIFNKHRIRPHECLTTNSYRVVEFLQKITKSNGGRPELLESRVVLKLGIRIICKNVKELIEDRGILNADPTLVFPASFGGIDKAGMLSHEAISSNNEPESSLTCSLDVADHDNYGPRVDAQTRIRILIERTENGWKALPMPGGKPISDYFELKNTYDTSTLLFTDLRKTGLRVRLVHPISFDEHDDCAKSLVMLAPLENKSKKEDQTLSEHVHAVESEAKRIADELRFREDDLIRIALEFAARWHDEGKKADIWQRFAYGPALDGSPLGKMAKARDPKSLRGYRHEFGSLLRIHHPERHLPNECVQPVNVEAYDLALHLIATHHGAGRPHFGEAVYADFNDVERDAIHTDSIRRFSRLQRKYGWWHLAWLENLLRCADAMASADPENGIDETEASDGGET